MAYVKCQKKQFPTSSPFLWANLMKTIPKWKVYGKVYGIAHLGFSGWWLTYPSEKYESQWEGLSHVMWKIQNV